MDITDRLREKLNSDLYERKSKAEVTEAFARLEINPPDIVKEFYMNFEGPFWEETFGMELLDIINDRVNVESITNECREEHMFPAKYLVLTEIAANEVIVLDTTDNKVYRVDFEGGDELLLAGQAEEDWGSFEEFLEVYFEV